MRCACPFLSSSPGCTWCQVSAGCRRRAPLGRLPHIQWRPQLQHHIRSSAPCYVLAVFRAELCPLLSSRYRMLQTTLQPGDISATVGYDLNGTPQVMTANAGSNIRRERRTADLVEELGSLALRHASCHGVHGQRGRCPLRLLLLTKVLAQDPAHASTMFQGSASMQWARPGFLLHVHSTGCCAAEGSLCCLANARAQFQHSNLERKLSWPMLLSTQPLLTLGQ